MRIPYIGDALLKSKLLTYVANLTRVVRTFVQKTTAYNYKDERCP